MKAMYQKNFKKVKKILSDENSHLGVVDIVVYPFTEIQVPFEHTKYSLGPWDDFYSSPLQNINLYQVVDEKQINELGFILVRDGLYTLMDFFNRFPDGNDFKTILIIHEDFKSFIPKKWSNYVLFYGFETFHEQYNHKTFNDSLLIKGSIMDETYSLNEVFSLIEKVKKQKKLKKIIYCALPRQNWFIDEDWKGDVLFSEIANNFIRKVYAETDPKLQVEFISWKDFFAMPDLHKYEFIDLNKKSSIYTDDYSDFFLFKRGAKPFFMKPRKNKSASDMVIPLTHCHGIRIFESPEIPAESYHEKLSEIFESLELKKGKKLNAAAFRAIADCAKNSPEKYEDKYQY